MTNPPSTRSQKHQHLTTQVYQNNARQMIPWCFSILIVVIVIIAIPLCKIKFVSLNNELGKKIQEAKLKSEQLDIELQNLNSKLEHLKNDSLKQYAPTIGLQKAEAAQIFILPLPGVQADDTLLRSRSIQTADNFR